MISEPSNASPEQKTTSTNQSNPKYGSSMPMWAWVLIYLVIGGIIYYAVYALYFAKKSGYDSAQTGTGATYTPPAADEADGSGGLYNY